MILRALLAVAGLYAATAFAQARPEPVLYNQVELQAEVSREVQNDLMNATMYAEASDPSAPKVSDQLNRRTAEALKAAGDFRTVRARSGYAQTYPVYDRSNKLTGWRGRSEIRLESRDVPAMAALIGKLQSTMLVGGISFSISPEARRQTESELIADAVAAFRARADVAAKALGGKSYRIRRIDLNTGGFMPGPRPMAAARLGPQAADVAPPVFEAGTSTVNVTASGSVEVE